MGYLSVGDYEYPPNYGLTQCAAWDQPLQPDCADEEGMPLEDAPEYCAQSWCYVDSETCSTGVTASNLFPDAGLYYSYDSCAAAAMEGEEADAEEEGEEADDEEGDEADAEDGEGEEADAEGEDMEDGEEEEELNPFGHIDVHDSLNDFVFEQGDYAPAPEEDCSCQLVGVSPSFTADGDAFVIYTNPEDMVEYMWQPNYGTTVCAAHDEPNAPFCADEFGDPLADAPEWCAETWCYVNAETCTQGVELSGYFPDSGLSYSYEVCAEEGSMEMEMESLIETELEASTEATMESM